MKAYFKTIFRMFSRHIARFFTIVAIVTVSVGFMSGLGEVRNKIQFAFNEYYVEQNVSDLIIKNKVGAFSADDISYLTEKFGTQNIMKGFSNDVKMNDDIVRIYNFDIKNMNINKLELLEGELPNFSTEVLAERKTDDLKGYNVGDKVSYMGMEFTVSGIVLNPMILHKLDEPSYIEEETLDNVLYLNNLAILPTTDVYVTFADRNLFDSFSKEYKKTVESTKESIELENITVLSLYENFGIYSLHSYADKVGIIGSIFVIFFLCVSSLVIFSTMTRLLDEERGQIATLKTLGYHNFAIIAKYLIFIGIATLIGGGIAFGIGLGLTQLLYVAFGIQYAMPEITGSMPYLYYLFTLVIILVSANLVTYLTGMKLVRTKPAKLLTPKAPIAGKKVFLEKIPFIWNRLSFKYKSSLRNVLLFRSRFYMTVVSIIGSTVLVLAGLGLLDCSYKMEMGSSLIMISVALIVFAGLLCALVIYNIANINISERNREIATLMVLGYHDKEVTGYIFREIYIMSAIGAVLGVPIGYGFLELVFGLIDFGKTADVNWWTWILAPVVTMLFTVVATMLLYKKITKTNMNESLKSIE